MNRIPGPRSAECLGTAMRGLVHALAAGSTAQEAEKLAIQHVAECAAATGAAMWISTAAGFERVAVGGSPGEADGPGPSALCQAVAAEDALQLPDARAHPMWQATVGEGRLAYLGAAIRWNGELLGVLAVVRTSGRSFQKWELVFLREAADCMAAALEHFRLIAEAARQATHERSRLDEQLRRVYDAIGCGIQVWDIQGNLVEYNAAAERILGIPLAGMIGRSISEVAPIFRADGTEPAISERRVMSAARTGQPIRNYISNVVASPGDVRWLQMTALPILGPDGTPVQVVSSFVDITERKRIEDQLQQTDAARQRVEDQLQATLVQLEGSLLEASEQAVAAAFREARTQAVMDSVADGVIVFDANGLIQSCNPAGEQIFGVQPGELLATQLTQLVPSLDGPSLISMVGTREVEGRTVSGTAFPLELTMTPIESEDYQVQIAVVRDVSQRREAETALAEARDSALQAVRAKSEFLATMSHEIRTPMNGVVGLTELLLGTQLDSQQRSYAESVQRSAEALLSIINDVLDFSKMEAGKLRLEQIDVDVRQVIGDVVELLNDQAERKGIGLVCRVDRSVPRALIGDPHRLRQILLNLVGNAVKFTASGEVGVRARVVDAGSSPIGEPVLVWFDVTDTGIGIDAEARERLFAPFVQADASTTREYGGTGLGLTISRQLVEGMGGAIGVDSVKGSGSTFWFTVPLAASAASEIQTSEAGQPDGQVVVARDDRDIGQVLIADDSTINQQVATGFLARFGLRTHVVSNGLEAVAAVERDTYVAVLMDCQMPIMDGFASTTAIRKLEGSARHTPVIAMTANALPGDRERCLGAGMDEYLTKPIRFDTLTAALVRCLVRGSSPAAYEPQPIEDASVIDSEPLDRAALDSLPSDVQADLLNLFFEEAPMRFGQVSAAVSAANMASLEEAAHAFKGDAATVGALEVASVCRSLEQHGRDSALEGCEPLVLQLETALARAKAAVAKHPIDERTN